MIQLDASDFSLKETLECGQSFRWRPAASPSGSIAGANPGAYYGYLPVRSAASGTGWESVAVKAWQAGSTLTVETADDRLTPEAVKRYFALDLDLGGILASIDVDTQIHDAISRYRGLRILRQDPWECLASFILSSFNNIKRIQLIIERLSAAYGARVSFNGFSGCAFPSPDAIAAVPERRLRDLGLGFRAPYLKRTAQLVTSGGLSFELLQRTDYATTKAALLACEGVGEKVADCVALFACEKYEAFPIDVWVERAMRYYFPRRRQTAGRMHAFAREHFGAYAGFAQQYLFHYVRHVRGNLGSTSGRPSSASRRA